MGKFNGKFNLDQALGIKSFINKDGSARVGYYRVGYYNDTPAMLIGFLATEEVPEEFIRMNVTDMLDKEFEIYSKDELSEETKKLDYRLQVARKFHTQETFDSIRIKRLSFFTTYEKSITKLYELIRNGEETFIIYTAPLNLALEESESKKYNETIEEPKMKTRGIRGIE